MIEDCIIKGVRRNHLWPLELKEKKDVKIGIILLSHGNKRTKTKTFIQNPESEQLMDAVIVILIS